MEKTPKLDPRQREVLERLIKDARDSERRKLENAEGWSESAIARELAEKKGCLPVLKETDELLEQIQESEQKVRKNDQVLRRSGFARDDSQVTLSWSAPEVLKKAYQALLAERRQPFEKSMKKYDLAILGVWTAETAEQAKKIAEALI